MEGTETLTHTLSPSKAVCTLLSASPGCVSSWSERSRPLRSCHFTSGHCHSPLGIYPQIPGLLRNLQATTFLPYFPKAAPIHGWEGRTLWSALAWRCAERSEGPQLWHLTGLRFLDRFKNKN